MLEKQQQQAGFFFSAGCSEDQPITLNRASTIKVAQMTFSRSQLIIWTWCFPVTGNKPVQ